MRQKLNNLSNYLKILVEVAIENILEALRTKTQAQIWSTTRNSMPLAFSIGPTNKKSYGKLDQKRFKGYRLGEISLTLVCFRDHRFAAINHAIRSFCWSNLGLNGRDWNGIYLELKILMDRKVRIVTKNEAIGH